MNRNDYLALRRRFQPETINLAVVAESPPASGRYFYNPDGACTEPLFAGLMKQLRFSPAYKRNGLAEFQRRGWILVDATYEAVNKLSDADRDGVIVRDYGLLRDDLSALMPDRSKPVVLIKANICRLLEPKLREDGFNVLNCGRSVYFPSSGRQPDFHRQFEAILSSTREGQNFD
jgi:hypothetical protein